MAKKMMNNLLRWLDEEITVDSAPPDNGWVCELLVLCGQGAVGKLIRMRGARGGR